MSEQIKIEPLQYEWDMGSEPIAGITAQEITTIDLSGILTETISITGAAGAPVTSISAGGGANGTWGTVSSGITFTDPYEEMEKRLAKLEAIIEEEQRIRDECPAVRNAYDEYRFLLVLAKRNKGDLLTDN